MRYPPGTRITHGVLALSLRRLGLGACVLVLGGAAASNAVAQSTDSVPHAVACHPLAAGADPHTMGCAILGERTLPSLPRTPLFWHLIAFPTRSAAEAAADPSSIVSTAEGRHWVFAVGPRNRSPHGGERIALVGPLPMPCRQPFTLTAAFAMLPPGSSSLVHTHAGPEAWYLLAGEQCLETPAGVSRVGARRTMVQRGYTPMQLNVTGNETRRALFIVLHDSATTFSSPSAWKPAGRCAAPVTRSRP
jgi:hypothetical protein